MKITRASSRFDDRDKSKLSVKRKLETCTSPAEPVVVKKRGRPKKDRTLEISQLSTPAPASHPQVNRDTDTGGWWMKEVDEYLIENVPYWDHLTVASLLTHCGLATPYGNTDLSQQWLVAWQQ